MKTSLALFITASLFAGSNAMCPNRCSEHGICGAFDRCTCYAGWTNGDCSGRICPYGNAWADVASGVSNREPHYYAECSGKGTCNRETGLCECLDGFEGKSCQRLSCPENCSGHGTCNLLGELHTMTTWDASKIQVCNCDAGWTGYACHERMCKKGDDPMSVHDNTGANTEQDEEQDVQIAITAGAAEAASTYILGYTDWRGEEYKTHPIEYPPTVHSVQEALEALPNNVIPSVTVTITQTTVDQDYTVHVTFTDSETAGDQPALTAYVAGCTLNGCQPVYNGVTNAGDSSTASATITEIQKGTAERVACSNRGICNTENGICECFEGFYGDSCNQQTIIM